MEILIYVIIIFIIYLINNILLIKLKKDFGENEFSKKVLDNSKNIISSILGILFVIIAINLIDFIKWPLIIFYSLAFLYEFIVSFMISFVLQIYLILKKERIEGESNYTILSNFISSLCYGMMVYVIFIYLF